MRNETLADLVDSTNQTTSRSEKADERNEVVKMDIGTLISSNDTKEGPTTCPNRPQKKQQVTEIKMNKKTNVIVLYN